MLQNSVFSDEDSVFSTAGVSSLRLDHGCKQMLSESTDARANHDLVLFSHATRGSSFGLASTVRFVKGMCLSDKNSTDKCLKFSDSRQRNLRFAQG